MKKETHSQYFIRMFYYWCGKLKISEPVRAIKDNRLNSPCEVNLWNDPKNRHIRYHSRKMGAIPKYLILSYVLHEIGHLTESLPYVTDDDKVLSEKTAEEFAIKLMKRYYSYQYGTCLKYMCRCQFMKKIKKQEPIYYKAYIQIKDYRNTIK